MKTQKIIQVFIYPMAQNIAEKIKILGSIEILII